MSDEKLSIEERIRRDVHSVLITTGRLPKLVYLVSQVDADTLIRGDIAAPARFQFATGGDMVGVTVDRWCPVGSVHRAYECSCGALFVDDRSRSGKCAVCMMNSLAETICELRSGPAVTTTCARCSATIDPAAVEQHHERCFVVGDRVRWTNEYETKWHASDPRWFEGAVTKVYPSGPRDIGVSVRIEDGSFQYRPGDHVSYANAANLRHIQRPGQAELKASADQINERIKRLNEMRMEHLASKMPKRDAELQDAMERVALPSEDPWEQDPMDALYDGVTLRELLGRSCATARGDGPLWRGFILTPVQRAAVSAHWSQQLRARISAAKGRERLSVTYCEVDVDD